MAALILGCCGFVGNRISTSRRARKERETEYNENFETLKEENARRVRQLSDAGVQGYEKFAGGATVATASMPASVVPPKSRDGRGQHVERVSGEMVQVGGQGRGQGQGSRTPPRYEDLAL